MSKKYLRRYTDLPSLIYLLRKRKITLDPESWDDTNDSHLLRSYLQKNRLKSVLALCFIQVAERYHHWRVFANGSSGVCTRFKRSEILNAVKKKNGLLARPVKFLKLNEMNGHRLAIEELPFSKRYPFQDEKEFRMVFGSKTVKHSKFDIDIPLSCIAGVTLSPWLHPDMFDHIVRTIKSIEGCGGVKIVRSTLINNEDWKRFGESATPPIAK